METLKKINYREFDKTNCYAALLAVASFELESKKIDFLKIGDHIFERKSFQFKNGKYNHTKAIRLISNAVASIGISIK